MKRTAFIAAVAVAAGSVVAPHAAAAEVPAVASGTLNWPIKQSFLRYVEGTFAAGEIKASDVVTVVKTPTTVTNPRTGAVSEANNYDVNFPIDAADSHIDASGNGVIEADGSIQFLAHKNWMNSGKDAMDVTFDDIKIKVTGTKAEVTADYVTKGLDVRNGSAEVNRSGDDAVITTFDLAEALVPASEKTYTTTDAKATLTQAGADALINFYQAGPLDDGATDLTVTFAKTESAKNEGSSNGGIIAAVVAILGLLGAAGAAFAGLIPGLKLPAFPGQN